jgi:hypothetical protein
MITPLVSSSAAAPEAAMASLPRPVSGRWGGSAGGETGGFAGGSGCRVVGGDHVGGSLAGGVVVGGDEVGGFVAGGLWVGGGDVGGFAGGVVGGFVDGVSPYPPGVSESSP